MRKYYYLLILLALISCKKENTSNDSDLNDTLKKIVIGIKESNGISQTFNPIIVTDDYWNTAIPGIISFSNDSNYILIKKYFNVNKVTYEEKHYQEISSFGNCEINTHNSTVAIHKFNDTVSLNDTFEVIKNLNLKTENLKNNYIAFRFGTTKKYIGWLKIYDNNGYKLEITDYCYYDQGLNKKH